MQQRRFLPQPLFENDIKRVTPFNLFPQLGYVCGCGVGVYSVAMFHLFTHAFSRRCCS